MTTSALAIVAGRWAMITRVICRSRKAAAMECAGQHDTLHLVSRQGAAHTADNALETHWHSQDVLQDRSARRTLIDPASIGSRIEATNIVCDRAREQTVMLEQPGDSMPMRGASTWLDKWGANLFG